MASDYQKIHDDRAARVAQDIIDEARVQLMLRFRFLDLALWRMELEVFPIKHGYGLATDGKKHYFDPDIVIARFEESFDELIRDYLHGVMHCIFRHPFDKSHDRKEAWNLACDVIAESAAMDLCGVRFPSELDTDRRAALSELRLLCGQLTPYHLYQLFYNAYTAPHGTVYKGLGQGRLNELASLFERDNHEAWASYAQMQSDETPGDVQDLPTPDGEDEAQDAPDMVDMQTESEGDESTSENPEHESNHEGPDEDAQSVDPEAAEATDEEQDSASQGEGSGTSSESDANEQVEDEKSQEERDWEEIAKQLEVNLETFSKEWGEEAGGLISLLKTANRKRYDYGDFLRHFSVLSEEMKINDDEFDNIFYTYGLDLYGNMPLIEPLEYKETQRIRDFVIAIDTSESTSGDMVKTFLQRTFDILKSQEDFAHSINVHIIQCDAKVQADTKITDLRQVDEFMEGFYIRGLGGTDFRPVFGYIDDLRTQGELSSLKGLIYFTDGLGTFPEKAPDYDAAFVFMDTDGSMTPRVPPWAMKVVLDEEGIAELAGNG